MSSDLQGPYVFGSATAWQGLSAYGRGQSDSGEIKEGVPNYATDEIEGKNLDFESIDLGIRFGRVARIACACLPVIGIILASIAEHAVMKIVEYDNTDYKNQFKISAIVNAVLTMALVVTATALFILLNPPLSIGMMGAVITLIHSPLFVGVAGAVIAAGGIFITAKTSSLVFNQKVIAEFNRAEEKGGGVDFYKLIS